MSQEPSLRELLAPMTEHEVELDGAAFRVDRERVLAGMARAHGTVATVAPGSSATRRGWFGYAALAAAGVVVLVLGARFANTGASDASLEVAVTDGSATHVTHVAKAGELETNAGSKAKVSTSDGLQIELENQTRVGLAELRPGAGQVRLLGGAIRCTIPHRSAAHAFRVVTPDVTVLDLGTVFTVSLEGPNHATRVSVEEGEVMVRHAHGETRVKAPSTWSSADPEPALRASAEPVPDSSAAPDSSASSDVPNAPSSTRGPAKGSSGKAPAATLEQEAQLLRQGLAAERQGRAADAAVAFAQLLKKYPHSPLVPDARAALTRVEASKQR